MKDVYFEDMEIVYKKKIYKPKEKIKPDTQLDYDCFKALGAKDLQEVKNESGRLPK